MFGATCKTEDNTQRVIDAAEKAAFRNFGHAAARIRKDAAGSIKKGKDPSKPGDPPTTRRRRGKNLAVAIRYDADKESAVIGPRRSVIGEAGAIQEHGEEHEPRPFMEPALEGNLGRFAADWGGSIGE